MASHVFLLFVFIWHVYVFYFILIVGFIHLMKVLHFLKFLEHFSFEIKINHICLIRYVFMQKNYIYIYWIIILLWWKLLSNHLKWNKYCKENSKNYSCNFFHLRMHKNFLQNMYVNSFWMYEYNYIFGFLKIN
jgi:hypothetical protein